MEELTWASSSAFLPQLRLHAPPGGDILMGYDHTHGPAAREPRGAHNEPALIVRAVAGILEVEFGGSPFHDSPDSAADGGRLVGARAARGVAECKVVGADGRFVAAQPVLAGKLLPRRIDGHYPSVVVQDRDVGREGVESRLKKALWHREGVRGCGRAIRRVR